MKKVDFGSGHNPRAGCVACDITGMSNLTYHFDPVKCKMYKYKSKHFYHNSAMILCEDNSLVGFGMNNVIHHIQDLSATFTEMHRVLKPGAELEIIECNEQSYFVNLNMDRLWYRGIIPRPEIWFSPSYRDYKKVLTNVFGCGNVSSVRYDRIKDKVIATKKG